MKKIIAITGTPGVGKTTIAKALARRLSGSELILANDVINSHRLYSGISPDGARIVRMKALERTLNRMVSSSKAGVVIVEGHIICDIRIRNAVAVVVREHLDVLNDRMRKRRYPKQKLMDNIVSEATDYCGVHAAKNYNVVYEFFSKEAEGMLLRIINGRKTERKSIELLDELQQILKKDRSYLQR